MRQPEVGQLDPLDAVLQQDVRRLDVAMNQPLFVGGRESCGDLIADPQNLRQAGRPLAIELLLQRAAFNVLHHDEWRPVLFVDRVNGHHMLVGDRSGSTGFPDEPPAGRRVGGEFSGDHLDRHDAVQLFVERFEDRPHPSLPYDLQNVVVAESTDGIGPCRRLKKFEPRHIAHNGLRSGLAESQLARRGCSADLLDGRSFEKLAGRVVSGQQRLQLLAVFRISGADPVQIGRPRRGCGKIESDFEESGIVHVESSASRAVELSAPPCVNGRGSGSLGPRILQGIHLRWPAGKFPVEPCPCVSPMPLDGCG